MSEDSTAVAAAGRQVCATACHAVVSRPATRSLRTFSTPSVGGTLTIGV